MTTAHIRRAVCIAASLPIILASQPTIAKPPADQQAIDSVPAVTGILHLFENYPIVAVGEYHGLDQQYECFANLIRHPDFAKHVDDIVVEVGNSLHQDLLDRYILGGDVSEQQAQPIWRNSFVACMGVLSSPHYADFFKLVRETNLKLPRQQRVRVLAGDVPIDWNTARIPRDVQRFMQLRDQTYARIVRDQVLSKNRKALLIMGSAHLVRNTSTNTHHCGVTDHLEATYPGSIAVVYTLGPHAVEKDIVVRTTTTLAPPALFRTEGNPLESLAYATLNPNVSTTISDQPAPTTSDITDQMCHRADYFLYLGQAQNLTSAPPTSDYLADKEFQAELTRRRNLLGIGHFVSNPGDSEHDDHGPPPDAVFKP